MLTDVAKIVDGVENNHQAAWMNETPAVILNVQRQPGANTISVVKSIKRLLPQLQANLPASIGDHAHRSHHSIKASVADVEFELMLTIDLVVLVIFLFLRNLLRHHYSQRGGAVVARRHLRGHVRSDTAWITYR